MIVQSTMAQMQRSKSNPLQTAESYLLPSSRSVQSGTSIFVKISEHCSTQDWSDKPAIQILNQCQDQVLTTARPIRFAFSL